MYSIFLIYGVISGYFAGFLGLGAGAFLMPFFMILGVPYQVAVDASLMAVFLSSLTSSVQHSHTNKPAREPCIVMAIPASIAALLGSFYFIHMLSPVLLMIIFSGLMFLNADFFRFVKNNPEKLGCKKMSDINHHKFFALYILVGILVGFSASLLGIGGGIIIVPILTRIAGFPVKEAVKVAVVVMIFSTFFGLLHNLVTNNLPYYIGSSSTIGAVVGCFLGSIALKYINQTMIVKIIYVVSLVLGFVMLFKAIMY